MSSRRVARRDERGLTIVFVGITIMMIMTLTALVIDHSFLRNDRRADQKVADAAATAGAFVLDIEDGRAACEAALASLVANTPGVSTFSGADCSSFPDTACNPATAVQTTSGTAGPYRVQIVHPVPDDPLHWMMATASAIGAPPATIVREDGSPCERIGVSVELTRAASFGSVLGAGDQTTRVHAVARAGTPIPGNPAINLLILERNECSAVSVGGQAMLRLGAVEVDGNLHPGVLAVDSDAHNPDGTLGAGCGTSGSPKYGTLHAEGTGAAIQADGPPGCPTDLHAVDPTRYDPGDGCGYLELLASGVPGPKSPLYCLSNAYWPACTNSNATLRPHPVRMEKPRTREPFDHRFDCRPLADGVGQAGYADEPWFGEHPIGGCAEATANTDFVNELMEFTAGTSTPAGWQTYSGPCTLDSTDVTFGEGNWVVTCDPFVIKKKVVFAGGNIIFNGTVDVTSGGDLTIHSCGREQDADPAQVDSCGSDALSWSADPDMDGLTNPENFDEDEYSDDAAWVVFRNGGFKKDARARAQIYDTALFFKRDAVCGGCETTDGSRTLQLSGGDHGGLIWHAPREGPFDVLAMWSESPLVHYIAGQSNLEMEGVYFAPVALLYFYGGGSQEQVAAQLVTERLAVGGNGVLHVTPNVHRAILDPTPYKSAIIR